MLFLLLIGHLYSAPLNYEALPQMLEHNGEWKKGVELLNAAEARRGLLKRSFLPTLSARAGRESFTLGPGAARTQNYGTLEANINVYNGGRDRFMDKAREAHWLSMKAASDDTKRDVLQRSRQLWMAWRHHHEASVILKSTLERNAEHLKAAQRRVNAGLSTAADVLDFQQYSLELEQQLAREEEEVHDHGRTLMALLNLSELPSLAPLNEHAHDDALLEQTFSPESHPRARSIVAESEALKSASERGRRWWTPRVDVYGALSHYSDRQQFFDTRAQRDDLAVGAMITVPLFDGGEARREAQGLAAQVRGEEAFARQVQRELEAEYEKAQVHVRLMHKLLHQAQESIKVAKRYQEMTLDEYRRGVKMSPDLREASLRLGQAQLLEAQTRWDYESARADLMALLGK
jgi:outer membrane protein TolC